MFGKKKLIITLGAILIFIIVLFFSKSAEKQVVSIGTNKSITVYPKEIEDVLNNPYMGWAPQAEGGPYSQPHRMVYAGITWREIESRKNSFNWSDLEKKYKFNYWDNRNVKVILRVIMDLPGKAGHIDIPDWLYNEINGKGFWYDNPEIGAGFSPEYNNLILIASHEKLVKELGKRYGNDSRIAFIELGSLGHWGEWHTALTKNSKVSFPMNNISNQYAKHYVETFLNKKCLMRRPFEIASHNKMGLYNDMFGTPQTDIWLSWINTGYLDLCGQKQLPTPEFWKCGPSGGEFAYGNAQSFLEVNSINESLRQVRESHTSWLGPCCPTNLPLGCAEQHNLNIIQKTMGYRFVVKSVSCQSTVIAGNTLALEMEWENKGVAPFYYRWPLEFSLSDDKGRIVTRWKAPEDIRTWLPGTKKTKEYFPIPVYLRGGSYTLCAAIIDPIKDKPGVDFAIKGRRLDGRYDLVHVKVFLLGHP